MDPRDLYYRYAPRGLHARVKRYVGSPKHRVESAMSARGLPIRSQRRGSVWAVAGVRNEQDVISHTVSHLLAQGVAGVIISDNQSTDSTRALIESMSDSAPVYLVDDAEPLFLQPEKMSYLAYLAWRAGAEWIVPFDADEHWYAPDGLLADFLATSTASVVSAVMHDVLPVRDTLTFEANEDVLVRRLSAPDAGYTQRKVAFRSGRALHVLAGNHDVGRGGERAEGLHLLHYQWRSGAHRARKARAGAAAHARAGSVGRGRHWAALATLDDQTLADSWEKDRRVAEQSPGWVRTRAPWLTWRSWDPGAQLQ